MHGFSTLSQIYVFLPNTIFGALSPSFHTSAQKRVKGKVIEHRSSTEKKGTESNYFIELFVRESADISICHSRSPSSWCGVTEVGLVVRNLHFQWHYTYLSSYTWYVFPLFPFPIDWTFLNINSVFEYLLLACLTLNLGCFSLLYLLQYIYYYILIFNQPSLS